MVRAINIAHHFEGHYVEQQHLPESIKDKTFLFPRQPRLRASDRCSLKELRQKHPPQP